MGRGFALNSLRSASAEALRAGEALAAPGLTGPSFRPCTGRLTRPLSSKRQRLKFPQAALDVSRIDRPAVFQVIEPFLALASAIGVKVAILGSE